MTKPSTTNGAVNIPTRFALIKRAEKILKDIDDFFDEADSYGLSPYEADPGAVLTKMRRGLMDLLIREGRLRIPSSTPTRKP